MPSAYRPPLMIPVDEAASLLSMTKAALYGKIHRGTSGLVTQHSGKTVRVSLKSVLAACDMTLGEYIEWQAVAPAEPRPKVRGAA